MASNEHNKSSSSSSQTPNRDQNLWGINNQLYTSSSHNNSYICATQEARSLPFVGERLADKIYEIITSGHLRRLDNVDHEKEKVIEMFKNIHGVGATTAQQFFAKVGR